MPMQSNLYPKDWRSIAMEIKQSVNWSCENCGRPCRRPGESWEEFEERVISPESKWAIEYWESVDAGELISLVRRPKRFVLTVAHLDHSPSNCDRANLRAWCAPCHCRYDLSQMGRKKMLIRERAGQLSIF